MAKPQVRIVHHGGPGAVQSESRGVAWSDEGPRELEPADGT